MKGGLVNVRQFLLERWILVRDAGMSQRPPEQATAAAAQLDHLRVLFPQSERPKHVSIESNSPRFSRARSSAESIPSSNGEYRLPVFPGIILPGSGDLLWREMVLGKLAPDSLFLSEDSEVLASFRGSLDISRVAQP